MWTTSIMMLSFIFFTWLSGAWDKYPELAVPLMLIYIAAVAPSIAKEQRSSDFKSKWKRLEKRRLALARASGDPSDEEIKIEDEMRELEAYNTPLTLGHLRAELSRIKNSSNHLH